MTVFVVFRATSPEAMGASVRRNFPNNFLEVQSDEWLISASGTAKDVSDRLGLTPSASSVGTAIVFSMANYYGRAPTEIWEWIKAKAES
jgi:hypothetical protein